MTTTTITFVLRSDCLGGECCCGTKLWILDDARFTFTSDPRAAMRFSTIEDARTKRKTYLAHALKWGWRPKVKIMRRTRQTRRTPAC